MISTSANAGNDKGDKVKTLYDTHAILLTASGDVVPLHKLDQWFAENGHHWVTKDQKFIKVEFSERGDTLWFVYQTKSENCWNCHDEGRWIDGDDKNTEWCEGHGDDGVWETIDFTRVNAWN